MGDVMWRELFSFNMGIVAACGIGALGTALLLLPRVPSLNHAPPLPEETAPAQKAPAPLQPEEPRVQAKLKRGETLLALLARHGIESRSAHELLEKVRPFFNPRKLTPGRTVEFVLDPKDQKVEAMELRIRDKIVRANALPDGWSVERLTIPSIRETRVVAGTIEANLYTSALSAGLRPAHVALLEEIFKYDIDFTSDFTPGDDFAALLEEIRYDDGRQVPRQVLAAGLEANGARHRAFYFVSKGGKGAYYDEDGKGLRNAFLRAPLSFTRISSSYNLARRHPIFRTVRPHLAIDYAAPAGTPVVAIGAGKVSFSGWRPGYGNLVEIRHTAGYSSRYGHFSRIARGVRRGTEVRAGDVIGFVGQTGHATGPHLHFEFLQANKKINFLAAKLPRTERLSGTELERFLLERDRRMAKLQAAAASM
jgi:murein DD-endopeptidase MepM/ murein hydrolase activator NlpD